MAARLASVLSCAAAVLLMSAAAGAQEGPPQAQPAAAAPAAVQIAGQTRSPTIQDRLRWELITDASSTLGGGGSSEEAPVPSLAGLSSTFVFRLDVSPLLNYSQNAGGRRTAKASWHLVFETGVVPRARAVTVRTEPQLSRVAEVLQNQGVTISGTPVAAPTLTRQRAFTVGGALSGNLLAGADTFGAFAETGIVLRANFDVFVEDDRFFEQDGLTYTRLATGATSAESGFFRGEGGIRFRLSQFDEGGAASELPLEEDGARKGRNISDLLLLEGLYQWNSALEGLVAGGGSENRWVMRFIATPRVDVVTRGTLGLRRMKFLIGIEVSDDFGSGARDVQLFYGLNADLRALLTQ